MILIFDLDGTLINSNIAHFNSFIKTFKRNKIIVTSEIKKTIKNMYGISSYNILKTLFKKKSEKEINKLKELRKKIVCKEEIENIKLIPHVKNFLKKKQKENKLIIATSSDKKFTELILKHFDLLKYFNLILTIDDVKKGKPNPEILNTAIKLIKGKKSEAIFFGDSIYDYESAKNAKIKFIGVLKYSTFKTQLLKKTRCINNFKEYDEKKFKRSKK